MRAGFFAVAAAAASCWAAPARAEGGEAEAAIRSYCEPLIAGAPAPQVAEAARAAGFGDDVVAGQSVLRRGELIVALSDAPRVCFVQAPAAMSLDEGMALADAWARRHPGAVRSPATRGPDGAPARGWSAPRSNMALIATQQPTGPGRTVMAFILMPVPRAAATAR